MLTMTYDGVDLRFMKGNKARVLPMCDSRPFPEFRVASSSIDGADGESLDWMTVGPREFSITLVTAGTAAMSDPIERNALAREIGALLLTREAKRFTFSDEKSPKNKREQLSRLAVPTGAFDYEEFMHTGRLTCTFKQLDPYLIGKKRVDVIDEATGSKYVKTIDVGGNAPANLVATTTPHDGATHYNIAAKGRSHVNYYAPFDGKHMLTINFKNQTVRVSKTQEDAAALGGLGLTSGSRFFEFSGRNLTIVATAPTTLSWYERWL